MKTLHLTLKKKWFDMILSGGKKEEYREIKAYWVSRLIDFSNYPKESSDDHKGIAEDFAFDLNNGHSLGVCLACYYAKIKPFDVAQFRNGYSTLAPTIKLEFNGLEVREGNPEWGAEPGKKYFVIKLGEKR